MTSIAYSVPLAMPAPHAPAQKVSWKEWFSPQLIPSSRLRQRQQDNEYHDDVNDGNDDSTQNAFQRRQLQQGRNRSSSVDLTPNRTNNAARIQNRDGSSMVDKSYNYSKSMPSSSHRRDGPVQASYLQTFLLRLNAVLPEYCMLLASTSEDTIRSIEEASKAIDVMEKKLKLDHTTIAGDVDLPIPSSPTLQLSSSMPDPSSPMHSPSKFDHWLSPQLHLQRLSPVGLSLKWNSKAELEWSRFTQPFLNLVGAECLYAAMEHMLDPSLSPTEMNISSKDFKGVKVPLGRVGGGTKSIPPPPPLLFSTTTSVDTSKRGSRRLIAIYRQVRDELVVVGEYLCDPVLPLASSVTRDDATISLAVSNECNPALELRSILDSLISFIDSRVILIRIHAEICNVKTPSSVNVVKDRDSQVTKLKTLAEQCRSAITNDKLVCVTQRVVSNVMKELKCMELVLTSIGNLLECDFFDCVLNVRRLHIHMTQIAYRQCLPMLYIHHCLPELMAMMHIYFAHFVDKEMMHLNSISTSSTSTLITTSLQSTLSVAVEFNKFTDFASLFSEFINANINTDTTPLTNALVQGFIDVNIVSHLSVALVHRSKKAVQYSSVEERKQNDDASDIWTTLYMKCGKDEYWPYNNYWAQIESVLTNHCSTPGVTNDPVKHTIVSATGGGNMGSPRQSVFCHTAAINDSICLIVIQGASGQTTKMHQRDKEIQTFLRSMVTKLSPENLLCVRALSEIKLKLYATVIEDKDRSRHRNSTVQVSSPLWSEIDWSHDQGNKVLHSLGLRKISSPVIAPLTSPYVNRKMRQLGEKHRMKSLKTSMNHGHLDFFLGSQLSKLPIPS